MHKIITKRYIREIVKRDLDKVSEESLRQVLEMKNIPFNRNCSRESMIAMIFHHKINLWYVYLKSKHEFFGVNEQEILKILDVDKIILEKLEAEKIINIAYYKDKYIDGELFREKYYLLEDIYNTSREKINSFKNKNKLIRNAVNVRATEKKENHIKKALKNRLLDAYKNYEYWEGLLLDDKYVIVFIQATGRNPKIDEILDIGIIDTNGVILYNSTFNINKRISDDTYMIKGVDKEILNNSPSFKDSIEEIAKVLDGRVILNYNSEFIDEIMKNNGYNYEIKSVCLMKSYMKYIHSRYIIRFKRALNMQGINQDERKTKALTGCFDTLQLIESVIMECKENIEELENKISKIS